MRVAVVVHDFLHYAKGAVIKNVDLIEHLMQHHAQHLVFADHPDDPTPPAAPAADAEQPATKTK